MVKTCPKKPKVYFLGLLSNSKGYNCYHPPTHKRFVSMDVTFHETIPFFTSGKSSTLGSVLILVMQRLALFYQCLPSFLIKVLIQGLLMVKVSRMSKESNNWKFMKEDPKK